MDKNGIFTKYGVQILGTPIKSIIESEDRKLFAERIAEIGEKVNYLITYSSTGLKLIRNSGKLITSATLAFSKIYQNLIKLSPVLFEITLINFVGLLDIA